MTCSRFGEGDDLIPPDSDAERTRRPRQVLSVNVVAGARNVQTEHLMPVEIRVGCAGST